MSILSLTYRIRWKKPVNWNDKFNWASNVNRCFLGKWRISEYKSRWIDWWNFIRFICLITQYTNDLYWWQWMCLQNVGILRKYKSKIFNPCSPDEQTLDKYSVLWSTWAWKTESHDASTPSTYDIRGKHENPSTTKGTKITEQITSTIQFVLASEMLSFQWRLMDETLVNGTRNKEPHLYCSNVSFSFVLIICSRIIDLHYNSFSISTINYTIVDRLTSLFPLWHFAWHFCSVLTHTRAQCTHMECCTVCV